MVTKDTLMAKASIKRYCIGSCEPCELSHCFVDNLAKISFAEGVMEVGEWIDEMSHTEYGSPDEGDYWAFSKKMWQVKLKEWGIG